MCLELAKWSGLRADSLRRSFLPTPTMSVGDSQTTLKSEDCWKDSQNFLKGDEFGLMVYSTEKVQNKSAKRKHTDRLREGPHAKRLSCGHTDDQSDPLSPGFGVSTSPGMMDALHNGAHSPGAPGTRVPLSRVLGLLPWSSAALRLAGAAGPTLSKDTPVRCDMDRPPQAQRKGRALPEQSLVLHDTPAVPGQVSPLCC